MAEDSTNLIIVESPSKARTLKRFLGDNYQIEASVGHIRDLPKNDLGVDVDNGFKPTYVASENKSKVISQLKSLIKKAGTLYLATDPDREGEAIAWHLMELLKPTIPVKRLAFHEITKSAIQESFDHTRDIDASLVSAQESRRILDRLWGYQVSAKLWQNVKGGLYAEYPSLNPSDWLKGEGLDWKLDFRGIYGTMLDQWMGLDSVPIVDGQFEQIHPFN